ncbi:MAG: VWA domain-containing protein [Acidobacteriaceae bacterium]|nr:VWA domain-containing protein [Acidobacteriaceae bacterium]
MIRCFVSLACCVCLTFCALARQAEPAASPAQPAGQPASSASPAAGPPRVTLDVVVRDKSGNPVAGLRQEDFTILDSKQPQPIVSFQAVGGGSEHTGLEVILVIDALNTGFDRVSFARLQIEKFLRQDAGKLAWPVSIDFLTDAGLRVQNTPSRDGNAVISYLEQNPNGLRVSGRSQGFYGASDRAQLSLRSLGELAQIEEQRPGRKIVIWLSPGWALLTGPRVQLSHKDQESIFNTAVSLSTHLRQARIALYTVDPLGTDDAGRLRTFYYEQFLKGLTSAGKAQFANLALQVFAQQSGGRILNSDNDIAGEIESCIRDASAYYVLAYEAPAADGPNDYHSIEVKLNQPQLKAQTRTGYYDQPVRPRTP